MKKSFFLFSASLLALAASAQSKKPSAGTTKSAAVTTINPGQQVYQQYCLTCHQSDGSGVPGLNPPLRQSDWVVGDKTRLINVILKGLQEPVEINGDTYDNVMPAHDFLSDKEVSDVLTFIRGNFNNKADAVTAEDVKKVRAVK